MSLDPRQRLIVLFNSFDVLTQNVDPLAAALAGAPIYAVGTLADSYIESHTLGLLASASLLSRPALSPHTHAHRPCTMNYTKSLLVFVLLSRI